MLHDILSYMRCPRCAGTNLLSDNSGISCRSCKTRYPLRDGILDVIGDDSIEVITPFQRVMQTPFVVSIYEKFWRRCGYLLASSRSFDQEVQTILRLQQESGKERLLDLACGTGIFTRPLARCSRGLVVGLDLSWPMLRHAQRLLRREGLQNVLLMHGSAFRLPFIAGAFPSVNCCGALHLFDNPDLALQEVARVLHAAGRLSVQTTIRPLRSGGVSSFLERFVRFGFFDLSELQECLRRRGFKMLESERHRISFSFLAGRIS